MLDNPLGRVRHGGGALLLLRGGERRRDLPPSAVDETGREQLVAIRLLVGCVDVGTSSGDADGEAILGAGDRDGQLGVAEHDVAGLSDEGVEAEDDTRVRARLQDRGVGDVAVFTDLHLVDGASS